MDEIDKKHRFDEEVFSYQATKDGRILLFWYGKQVKVLKSREAQKFLHRITDLDQREIQLVIAKLTGNFKRGNER
jgi:hypothetical protein